MQNLTPGQLENKLDQLLAQRGKESERAFSEHFKEHSLKGMPPGEVHYISAGRRVGKSHMAELYRKYMNENFGILYEEPMSIATCGGLNIGR